MKSEFFIKNSHFREPDANLYCYDAENEVCIRSDLEIASNPHPSIPIPDGQKLSCMSKRVGCNFKGRFYNIGESDPGNEITGEVCGQCQGRGLFEHPQVMEHDECLPPFEILEFKDSGIVYKYCLFVSSKEKRTCDAERECIKLNSFLATLDSFPDRKYLTNLYNFTGRGNIF